MQKETSIKQKTLSGLFWSFSDLIANQGIQFIIQIVLARLLLPEYFGVIGMTTVFIAISNSIIDSGVSQALIREQKVSQADYSTVFYFNFVMSMAMYGLLYFSAPTIGTFFNEHQLISIIRVLSLGLIINSIAIIQRVHLTKSIDFRNQMIINLIAGISSGVIAIIFAALGFGVWSLVIKTLSMQLAQSILLWILNRWRPSLEFNYTSFKSFFGFGWRIMVSGLISNLYSNIYYILIGRMYSAVQLGYFTNADKLKSVAAQSITSALQSVTYPVFSSIQEDEERLRYGFRKIIRITTFINFPLMVGLAAIANPLIHLLFGQRWMPMIIYFQLLCLEGMLFPILAINLNVIQVKGKASLYLWLSIVKRAILTLLIIGVIWLKLGVIGLVVAAIIHSNIAFWMISYFSGREISYFSIQQIKDLFLISFITAIMGIIVYFSGMMLPQNDYIKLILQIIIGCVIYIGMSKIANLQELKEVWYLILPIFKKGRIGKTKLSKS